MQARRRAKQALEKGVNLDELLASGESGAYEALQLYRSKALRQESKGEHTEALKTTVEGTVKLIRGGYFAACTELCSQLVDLLNKTEADITNAEIREIVFAVDDAFVRATESSSEDIIEGEGAVTPTKTEVSAFRSRKDYLKGCVKWSQTWGRREYGDPALHLRLASALWATDSTKASYHYVVGESPLALSQKISDTFGAKDQIVNRDRALTLGVCNFLGLENLRDANELLAHFKKAQRNRGNNVDTKLVTFCSQLLECCRRDAAPLFKQLVNYVIEDITGWGGDMVPTLVQGPIAVKFFNMQPKVHPMMQMMQQFLG